MDDFDIEKRLAVVRAHLGGKAVSAIAQEFDVSRPYVYKWIRRFEAKGEDGLKSRKSPGRPQNIGPLTRSEVLRLPRETRPPIDLGDEWTSKLLADLFGVSQAFVTQTWRKAGFKPWLTYKRVFSWPESIVVWRGKRVPAWLAMHVELCELEGQEDKVKDALAATEAPEQWVQLSTNILRDLGRRWNKTKGRLPRVDPRTPEYRNELKRKAANAH